MNLKIILREEIEQNNLKNIVLTQLGKKYDYNFNKALMNNDIFIVDGKNISYKGFMGKTNRCETNVFNVVSNYPNSYLPVAGMTIDKKSLFMMEHFWLYSTYLSENLEVTPVGEGWMEYQYYLGVINKNINDEIENAQSFTDIEFLKSGHFWHKYLK